MRFLFVVVGEEGLEPTVQIGTDLQSARLPITVYSPNYERKIVCLSKYIFFIRKSIVNIIFFLKNY